MMSLLLYFIKSWVIGIAIAAPVGPIGMLCIRKTLEVGMKGAIAVGLGAALADSVYGMIAAFGLSTITHFLLAKTAYIQLVGGAFLLYLAYKEVKNNCSKEILIKSSKMTFEVFILTLTNPMTILSFIGVFASIGGDSFSLIEAITMVLGIFLGSMSWWLVLGSIITKIRHKLPEGWLKVIKYFSAGLIGGFGVYALISSISYQIPN